jgi:hypothetical protein
MQKKQKKNTREEKVARVSATTDSAVTSPHLLLAVPHVHAVSDIHGASPHVLVAPRVHLEHSWGNVVGGGTYVRN